MQKRIFALLLAAAMTMSMAACGSSETPAETKPAESKPAETTTTPSAPATTTPAETPAVERDTFTMAISYMPDSLSPDTGGSDDYTTMIRPLYDRLFMENNEGGIDYYLAESLEISPDGKTYTVKLRDDITWSDGTPITTKDIQFSMDITIAKKGYNNYTRVNGVDGTHEIIDDQTFAITIPEAYNYYISTLSNMIIYPAHQFADAQAVADDQTYYTQTDIVTSGAFTVKEINADSIVYEAREDYYRGVPQIKNIVLKVIGAGAKAIAFENGEIDYMRITTVDELEKYSAQTDKYNIYSMSEARLNYLQVNPYGPNPLNEEQREALFYAINGDEVIMGAYGSTELAQNPNSFLVPTMSMYNPETPDYEYNLEKAKELAKSTGLEGKELIYIYNKDRANMEAIAVVLQQQLAQIGVTLKIEGLDSTSFFNRFGDKMFGTGNQDTWDLCTNGWDSMRGNTLYQSYLYFNQGKDCWGMNEACADLAIEVNTIQDPEERQKAADHLMEVAMGVRRIYPLTYTNYVMVAQKYVTGLDTCDIVPEFVDWMAISVNG